MKKEIASAVAGAAVAAAAVLGTAPEPETQPCNLAIYRKALKDRGTALAEANSLRAELDATGKQARRALEARDEAIKTLEADLDRERGPGRGR